MERGKSMKLSASIAGALVLLGAAGPASASALGPNALSCATPDGGEPAVMDYDRSTGFARLASGDGFSQHPAAVDASGFRLMFMTRDDHAFFMSFSERTMQLSIVVFQPTPAEIADIKANSETVEGQVAVTARYANPPRATPQVFTCTRGAN